MTALFPHHPTYITWDLPTLPLNVGQCFSCENQGSGLQEGHLEDRSCDLPQQVPWCHYWRPHAELKGIDLNESKTLKLCLTKESPKLLIFIIPVHTKGEEGHSKAPETSKPYKYVCLSGKQKCQLKCYYHSSK